MPSRYPEHATPLAFSADSFSQSFSPDTQTHPPSRIQRFIEAHRNVGYRAARLDPLARVSVPEIPQLTAQFHGLDPAQPVVLPDKPFRAVSTVRDLELQLKRVYCDAIGMDCSAIRDEARRQWLFAHQEAKILHSAPTTEQRLAVLNRLVAAEMWEHHVAAYFGHVVKRFSLEGCESLVPLLDALIDNAGRNGLKQIFLGMPHRGRLNALVNVMDFPAGRMLDLLDYESEAATLQTDLPYHLGGVARKATPHGDVTVFLAHNPSHLQSVFPVVCGMARAWQDDHRDASCLPIVVHGDAAFAGQGIVMETLNLTAKRGYALDGTIHVIVNNQIGFTTPNVIDVNAHSYCTDIARMIDAPVIHVNADRPDEVIKAVEIAFDYRMTYQADVVIDLIGYRRLGHSEHDIPAITQPHLHAAIATRPTVTELYHAMVDTGTPLSTLREHALHELKTQSGSAENWKREARHTPTDLQPMSLSRIQSLTAALTKTPAGMQLHDLVRNVIAKWQASAANESCKADWCFAENIAYASLLDEGHGVRLSGMDVGRGTFMHRHAVWHLQDGGAGGGDCYVPLANIAPHQGDVDIVNSPLTEEAVLGFEYGYSVESKKRLTIWEAQFGDFVNGAQVIIDQYIAPGEFKWGYQSALTILLPHGHEGVGPEHSSGYLGRFLQLCADDNLRVAYPSTSAQWFHLLREQATAQHPKPLVVMSPKSQLYGDARSHSALSELISGSFAPVLRDVDVQLREKVTRVVLCSGKLFYQLQQARDEARNDGIALVRIEQLYPFPSGEVADALAEFRNLDEVVWAQEEDKNQGAWRFVRESLEEVLPAGCHLTHVCRTATAAGAHSSMKAHLKEQNRLVSLALTQRNAHDLKEEEHALSDALTASVE
ncbi:2-oxoglutarate dehydrogenase E1 component [Paraburkholderia youngii]|uniref:2-oxoglutarate dehydrogenase E1 component n=1 Tax=Paraburkholderia youngii TaxID=2782701 RepID=UPI003D1BE4F6